MRSPPRRMHLILLVVDPLNGQFDPFVLLAGRLPCGQSEIR
jgi:hypothetical protein